LHTRVGKVERTLAALLFFGALAGGAVAFLSGRRWDDLVLAQKPPLEVTTVLSEAYGVKRGTPVLLAGVEAGAVRDVAVMEDERGAVRVEVNLFVSAPFRQFLRRGTIARVKRPPLLGEATIDLLPGARRGEPLAPGDRIAAVAPERVEDEIAAGVRDLHEAVRALIDGRGTAGMLLADNGKIYDEVDEAVKRLTQAASRLESAAVEVGRAAHDIPALVEEARDATREGARVVGAAKKSVFIRGNIEPEKADPHEVEVRPRVAGP
jgi:ABC-type transporter Mla subunit MlaD